MSAGSPELIVNIDEVERIAKAANPGPWVWEPDEDGDECLYSSNGETVISNCSWDGMEFRWSSDEDHVAAANPFTVLSIIERLRAAEAALERIAHECIIRKDGNAVQTVADMKAIARDHLDRHKG